ncbi:hypothetical protein EVAR_17687_1 [Eumeta japonica]|uniref:Uncharacterized protein n=1 Tax=Eumeta variegata TaxID=151549 RepID=A0A4C1US51_EUMVA|nr:hypothetical protein EVAR_17687_1 [Eumeta japonica]
MVANSGRVGDKNIMSLDVRLPPLADNTFRYFTSAGAETDGDIPTVKKDLQNRLERSAAVEEYVDARSVAPPRAARRVRTMQRRMHIVAMKNESPPTLRALSSIVVSISKA